MREFLPTFAGNAFLLFSIGHYLCLTFFLISPGFLLLFANLTCFLFTAPFSKFSPYLLTLASSRYDLSRSYVESPRDRDPSPLGLAVPSSSS